MFGNKEVVAGEGIGEAHQMDRDDFHVLGAKADLHRFPLSFLRFRYSKLKVANRKVTSLTVSPVPKNAVGTVIAKNLKRALHHPLAVARDLLNHRVAVHDDEIFNTLFLSIHDV